MLAFLRHAAIPPAILLVALAGAADGREVTEEDRAALETRIASFEVAMTEGDAEVIIDAIPPRLLSAMIGAAGVSTLAARTQLIGLMDETFKMMQTGTFSFDFDVEAMKFFELSDGTPYAIIPSELFMTIENVSVRSRSETLALFDAGEWYLLRVDEIEQVVLLRTVYPLFASVQFNGPVYERIEP